MVFLFVRVVHHTTKGQTLVKLKKTSCRTLPLSFSIQYIVAVLWLLGFRILSMFLKSRS